MHESREEKGGHDGWQIGVEDSAHIQEKVGIDPVIDYCVPFPVIRGK